MTDQTELLADINALTSQFRTVLMATSSLDAEPEISYSPYVIVDGKLYVLLSDLARHTGNLKSNPRASLLFIESEAEAEKLHARKRVTYEVAAQVIDRESGQWGVVLKAMQDRFGSIMQVLESLPDFHLFAMTPSCAVLVLGFADAHTLECSDFAAPA